MKPANHSESDSRKLSLPASDAIFQAAEIDLPVAQQRQFVDALDASNVMQAAEAGLANGGVGLISRDIERGDEAQGG
jgi:hypothetical protein